MLIERVIEGAGIVSAEQCRKPVERLRDYAT
jgi:hypothetical protein